MSFSILGSGHYVPPRVVTNDELSTFLDTSDAWISERTGIRERRVCVTENATDLAVEAAKRALDKAGVAPEELDLILCGTVSGQYVNPPLACMVQERLGATCPCLDVNAGCSVFLYMLECAAGYFARKTVKKMLVIGSEQMSRILDWTDRSTCILFGDGAGALVLGEGDDYLASTLYAKGDDRVIRIPTHIGNSPFYQGEQDSPYVHMNGQETYKFAVHVIVRDIEEVLRKAGVAGEDVRWVVPHQTNRRIIDAAGRRVKSVGGDKFFCNIDRYGNTSAASIPLALDELAQSGQLQKGDLVVLAAFGGGLSSGACLIRW